MNKEKPSWNDILSMPEIKDFTIERVDHTSEEINIEEINKLLKKTIITLINNQKEWCEIYNSFFEDYHNSDLIDAQYVINNIEDDIYKRKEQNIKYNELLESLFLNKTEDINFLVKLIELFK